MAWKYLGKRWDRILGKSLKMTAWSRGLQTEIASGYSRMIMISSGEQYVLEEEFLQLQTQRNAAPLTLEYLHKVAAAAENIKIVTEKKEIPEIIRSLIRQMTYYYIAKLDAERIYLSKDIPEKDKVYVAQWINRDFFLPWEKALITIAASVDIDPSLLEWYTLDELENAIGNDYLDKDTLLTRENSLWSLILKDNQITLLLGRDCRPLQENNSLAETIRGTVVYKNQNSITGTVGIDILVVPMTNPDMIKELSDITTIITDEGGILSHAAVLCREFKIPGIVGTKIATKVFKEGDRLEIDFSQGTITKIS